MKDLTTTTDLPTLAQHIIRTHQQVEDSKNQAILHAITCGAALIEATGQTHTPPWPNPHRSPALTGGLNAHP